MDKNNDVKIKQINPQTKLSDLEKTAILEFRLEAEEELSKTKQFKLLNKKNKKSTINLPSLKNNDLDLPNLKQSNSFELPKKKENLSQTIKLKLSDLRRAIENNNINTDIYNKKKSLYDTIIIKLDDLINKKNAIKAIESKKVKNIENTKTTSKKSYFCKPKDITKMKHITLNIDSEEFPRQLYNLNKIALNNLSYVKQKKVRKYSNLSKLEKIDNINISEENFKKYKQKMNKVAINKLYYKFAPKESNKYKIYKLSVITSCLILFISCLFLLNWFIQGLSTKNLSNSITEDVVVTQIEGGELYNIDPPSIAQDPTDEGDAINPYEPQGDVDQYHQYLNTPLSSVDFKNVLKANSDTVGWLIVNNTNVNYPVVQAGDNDYYLTHSFDKSFNYAGWVFADFRNNFDTLSNNTVIYAHGRKDKVMFGSLLKTIESSWYQNKDNQIIQFSTLKYDTMWQIFSIYTIEAESYYITTDFSSTESFLNFAQTMKDRSIYNFGIDIKENDKLLTLSTCLNDKGMRVVIQAKLVKIQEKTNS